MTDTTNFDTAMAGDARAMARFDAVAEKLIADARSEGLEISREDLKALGAVKLAVFTDLGLDTADAMAEIRRGPAAEQLKRREMLAQLDQKNSALHAELSRLPPAARMEVGRALERQRPHLEQAAPQQLTAEQEAERIIWIRSLPPAQRIAAARAAGLC